MKSVNHAEGKFWITSRDVPMKMLFDEALKDFRQALTDRGVYKKDHQNLERAYNGARDFVDFLLDGPWALEKGRRRPKST